ncbi:chorismate-binding protein [Changchengzhania lutea]|uniref:chorismate-binding protein n=1 Tax=Changchengzhania lutea TaxID=2049305 RepID=UPI00115EC747|nr:chorismate-binding protein [Changchengzhania lutea]
MTLENFYDRISSQLKSQLPFVVYRKPNEETTQAIFQHTNDLYQTSTFTESGFVFAPFDNERDAVLMPFAHSEKLSIEEKQSELLVSHTNTKSSSSIEDELQHIELIKRGINAIENTDLKKVVLSRKETMALSDDNPISIFRKLLSHYKSAFVYCWYHPKVGLWLGATPETLLKLEGNNFSIMSLAGTQNYDNTLKVTWKQKELQEQQYVTDFILDTIKPVVKDIKVSETETVKTGNLLHLKTKISGHVNPQTLDFKKLLEALHPTPAVCGLPKATAKAFILKHEGYDREYYTGFLGELHLEKETMPRSANRNIENRAYAIKRKCSALYVNLRCMQIIDHQATIYVGGGITKDSITESEWEETVSKSLVMKKVL